MAGVGFEASLWITLWLSSGPRCGDSGAVSRETLDGHLVSVRWLDTGAASVFGRSALVAWKPTALRCRRAYGHGSSAHGVDSVSRGTHAGHSHGAEGATRAPGPLRPPITRIASVSRGTAWCEEGRVGQAPAAQIAGAETPAPQPVQQRRLT